MRDKEGKDIPVDFGVYCDGDFDILDGDDQISSEQCAIDAANSSIDDYRDCASEGWDDEVANIAVFAQTHQTERVGERPRSDEDCHVSSDCETVCDYELFETAWWASVQSRLRRADELESELAKYKEKATIDGEGNPITVGDTVYYDSAGVLTPAKIEDIVSSPSKGLLRVDMPPTIISADECYLNHEAVPEQTDMMSGK